MTAADAGRSAARRGQDWQRKCAAYARTWYPSADHCGNIGKAGGSGDLLGIGDRIIECTVEPLTAIAKKLREAEGDALRSEFDQWFVWKTAKGEPVGRSYVITRAEVLWPLLARLDRLEGMLDEAYAELEAKP